MKKLVFIVLVIVLGLFTACSNRSDVALMHLYVDEGPDVPRYMFSETNLDFVPDYTKRNLSVKYARVFPQRTDQTDSEDVLTDGVLGGEFFDKFVKLVDRFEKPYDILSDSEVDGGSNLKVRIETNDGKAKEYDIRLAKDDADFSLVNSFYTDVMALFTQDIY